MPLSNEQIETLYARYQESFDSGVRVIKEIRALPEEDWDKLVRHNRSLLAAIQQSVAGRAGGRLAVELFLVIAGISLGGHDLVTPLVAAGLVVGVSILLSVAAALWPRPKTKWTADLICEVPTWRAPNSLLGPTTQFSFGSHSFAKDDSATHLQPAIFNSDHQDKFVKCSSFRAYRYNIVRTLPQIVANKKKADGVITKLFSDACNIANPKFLGSKLSNRLPAEEELIYLREILKYKDYLFGRSQLWMLNRAIRKGRFADQFPQT